MIFAVSDQDTGIQDTCERHTISSAPIKDDVPRFFQRWKDESWPGVRLSPQCCLQLFISEIVVSPFVRWLWCEFCSVFYSIFTEMRMFVVNDQLSHRAFGLSLLQLSPANFTNTTNFACRWRRSQAPTNNYVGIFDVLVANAGVLRFADELGSLETL